MRLGVLDVGSNTVKLQIVDGYGGAPPLPVHAYKRRVRLAEAKTQDKIESEGERRLIDAIRGAADVARRQGVNELIPFATATIRDACNGREICDRIVEETGIPVQTMTGQDEARLIYLAAHRWYGWSARQLLVLDIGGGSFEIAHGRDEQPDLALSLPLGASRLTNDFLPDDPADHDAVAALRHYVRSTIGEVADRLRWEGKPSLVVGTSKTFKQLARLTGAPHRRKGPFVPRTLRRRDVRTWTKRLAAMPSDERAALRGVAASRAGQIVAGAIVAEAAMDLLDIKRLEICPWALREGILLRRMDVLHDAAAARDEALIASATHPGQPLTELSSPASQDQAGAEPQPA